MYLKSLAVKKGIGLTETTYIFYSFLVTSVFVHYPCNINKCQLSFLDFVFLQ